MSMISKYYKVLSLEENWRPKIAITEKNVKKPKLMKLSCSLFGTWSFLLATGPVETSECFPTSLLGYLRAFEQLNEVWQKKAKAFRR